jgi:hypothetical protein
MRLNVNRKVFEKKLNTSKFLYPLYEVIVNAIDAIEDANINNGEINITVKRNDSQLTIDKNDKILNPIEEIEKKKVNDIQTYIMSSEGFKFRHLLNNLDNFKNISPNLSNEDLDAELHKIDYKLQQNLKKDVKKLLDLKTINDFEEYTILLQDTIKKEHEFTISKLADYVIQRNVIIKFFASLLERDNNNSEYKYEKDLHNIIFPMGGDSDSVSYEQHNLWLLDEKLTFHTYVASDKKIKSMSTLESKSLKELDLAIFDMNWAFSSGEPFHSIIVFEFKRPGKFMNRKDVDTMLINYFEDLMKSKAKNYRGKLINLENTTPKFGYIICEIDKDLGQNLLNFEGYRRTSAQTYYKYLEQINLYIEVMTYQTMLKNVEMRHKTFFKQLGIDKEW